VKTENTAYLLLGSNIGNRKENLKTACMLINEKAGKIIVASSTYKTAPWKMKNAGEFLNLAVCIKTALQPDELLEQILYLFFQNNRYRYIVVW
jgi:2-amino-4-hydroxy-6-hydroxymethyldihydropteridine diphosphokinase